uniref:Thioredoxin domain-containing protein n=1 Tax=Compsopogon caeruleus TaxID=31354 RepID=A0A7S1T4G2_9RHOD|mmetsp:Transcript_1024/g.2178  ORF Transcript_1024/g.2178 Transcript_1024/m.2178 type:complete len:175 (+) Transcript_1024:93-617(+)
MVLQKGDSIGPFLLAGYALESITEAEIHGKTAVFAFFPAAFSGGPEEGCEMQLCGLNSLVAEGGPLHDKSKFITFGVSGDLPFANQAFGNKLHLDFPLLSDPTLAFCERAVGKCHFGEFLKDHKVSRALVGALTTNRGCLIVNPGGEIIYSFSSDGHPGLQPSLSEIRDLVAQV